MDLIRVADAAHPFDYSILPPDVRIVLHYIGLQGSTPHIITRDELAALRAAGKVFYPIVTVPQRTLFRADGDNAADACWRAVRELDIDPAGPWFMDIEYGAYALSPAGARECVDRWRYRMAKAGVTNVHVYGPLGSGFDWVAHWTAVQPASLPNGAVGVQYDHALANDSYDISVFDPSIFPQEVTAMPLTDDDLQRISQLFDGKLAQLFNRLHGDLEGTMIREVSDLADAEQAKASLSSIQAGVDRLAASGAAQLQVSPVSIPATILVNQTGPASAAPAAPQGAGTVQPVNVAQGPTSSETYPVTASGGQPLPPPAPHGGRFDPAELNAALEAQRTPAGTSGPGQPV